MTDKRFIINKNMSLDNQIETYELSCLVDNENKTFYFIVDSIANVELFVKRLNELYEENQALKTDRARYEEECRLDVFKELSEENEELKAINKYLIELLEHNGATVEIEHIKGDME